LFEVALGAFDILRVVKMAPGFFGAKIDNDKTVAALLG